MRRVGVWNWKEGLDLSGECESIVHRAQAGQDTIVNLGCLILVALANGDAFTFHLEDKLACVLCRGGERTDLNIQDRGRQWAFEWPCTYEQRGGGADGLAGERLRASGEAVQSARRGPVIIFRQSLACKGAVWNLLTAMQARLNTD